MPITPLLRQAGALARLGGKLPEALDQGLAAARAHRLHNVAEGRAAPAPDPLRQLLPGFRREQYDACIRSHSLLAADGVVPSAPASRLRFRLPAWSMVSSARICAGGTSGSSPSTALSHASISMASPVSAETTSSWPSVRAIKIARRGTAAFGRQGIRAPSLRRVRARMSVPGIAVGMQAVRRRQHPGP